MAYKTGTIPEIHQQLTEDGYHIAENTLRVWVKKGILKAAFIGKKAYISYDNVLTILMNGTQNYGREDSARNIRRITC